MTPIISDIDFVHLFTTVGLPTAALVAIGYAAWRFLGWFGREIIIHLRDRLVSRLTGFFDRVDTSLDSVTAHMQQHTEALRDLKEAMTDNRDALDAVRESRVCHFDPSKHVR